MTAGRPRLGQGDRSRRPRGVGTTYGPVTRTNYGTGIMEAWSSTRAGPAPATGNPGRTTWAAASWISSGTKSALTVRRPGPGCRNADWWTTSTSPPPKGPPLLLNQPRQPSRPNSLGQKFAKSDQRPLVRDLWTASDQIPPLPGHPARRWMAKRCLWRPELPHGQFRAVDTCDELSFPRIAPGHWKHRRPHGPSICVGRQPGPSFPSPPPST